MYVDESGDTGIGPKMPSPYFTLTGLVVHELRWHDYLSQLIGFRNLIEQKYGLPATDEIHAGPLLRDPNSAIPRSKRLTILREYADLLAGMTDLRIINVVVDKKKRPNDYAVFDMAWTVLIQRFENTLRKLNFPGPCNYTEMGMMFPDQTSQDKLIKLLDSLRQSNPIPNQFRAGTRNLVLTNMVERPMFYDSAESLYIQSADVAAYLFYQHIVPNKYMAQKAGNRYFLRLEPVLCKVASKDDPLGIVRL